MRYICKIFGTIQILTSFPTRERRFWWSWFRRSVRNHQEPEILDNSWKKHDLSNKKSLVIVVRNLDLNSADREAVFL
jgi:hypothetical protein